MAEIEKMYFQIFVAEYFFFYLIGVHVATNKHLLYMN